MRRPMRERIANVLMDPDRVVVTHGDDPDPLLGLETGPAVRSWIKVAEEFTRRTGLPMSNKLAQIIGSRAIAKMRMLLMHGLTPGEVADAGRVRKQRDARAYRARRRART